MGLNALKDQTNRSTRSLTSADKSSESRIAVTPHPPALPSTEQWGWFYSLAWVWMYDPCPASAPLHLWIHQENRPTMDLRNVCQLFWHHVISSWMWCHLEWILRNGMSVLCEGCSRHGVIDAARMRFAILTSPASAELIRSWITSSGSRVSSNTITSVPPTCVSVLTINPYPHMTEIQPYSYTIRTLASKCDSWVMSWLTVSSTTASGIVMLYYVYYYVLTTGIGAILGQNIDS